MDLAKAARDPWVWGQLALFVVIALMPPLLPRYLNLGSADFVLNRIDPLWIRALGAAPLAAGILVMLWGLRSLGKNLTPGTEPLPQGQLVTTGAYAHFRHPMYSGMVLLAAGYTLIWSNWTLAFLLGLLTLQYFQAKARAEERWLRERFPAYTSYVRQVPRRVL